MSFGQWTLRFWSKTGALALAIVMLFGLGSTAHAAEWPGPITGFAQATLYTDTLPTTVAFAKKGYGYQTRVVCVGVKTGPGHSRVVNIWNGRYHVVNTRVQANSHVGCTGHSFQAWNRYAHVEVTEDLPGPWNIVSRKYVRLW